MKIPVNVGTVIGGKYRIERILGSGGMSVVALAKHLELEQEVAIKFLGPALDRAECAERFRREARAAARIRSPHVARVLDFGVLEDESPFMVMEYLEGNDLAEELDRRRTLPVPEIVGYVLQAVEALAEAHANGIVHRDIKPENLFLCHLPDRTRSIKVLDFGISRSFGGPAPELALTKTATFIGSPLYMSPEQMRSPRHVDHRTDIWSLGAVLYEAVSGRPPYVADTIPELCTLVLQEKPPQLSALCRDLPAGFEEVVFRCLEKDREERFANLAELAQALAPFAPGSFAAVERASRILTFAGNRPAANGTLNGLAPLTQPSRAEAKASRADRHRSVELESPAQRTVSTFGTTRPAQQELRRRPWAVAASLVTVGALFVSMLMPEAPPPLPMGLGSQGSELVVDSTRLTAVPTAAAASLAPRVELDTEPATRWTNTPLPESVPSTRASTGAPIERQARARTESALSSGVSAPARALAPAPAAAAEPAPRRIDPWDPASFGGRQ
jgi:serine/threonine-protein kinase